VGSYPQGYDAKVGQQEVDGAEDDDGAQTVSPLHHHHLCLRKLREVDEEARYLHLVHSMGSCTQMLMCHVE
jgi:hypothetical protein